MPTARLAVTGAHDEGCYHLCAAQGHALTLPPSLDSGSECLLRYLASKTSGPPCDRSMIQTQQI